MELEPIPLNPLVVLEALNTLAVFVAVKNALEACDPGNILCSAVVNGKDATCSCDLVFEARSGELSTAPLIGDDCVKEDECEEKVRVILVAPEVTGVPDPVVASRFLKLKALFDEKTEFF